MKQARQPSSTLRLASSSSNGNQVNQRRKISRKQLINLLNRINFLDGEVAVQYKHKKFNHILPIQAKPQICNNDYLRCLWSKHFDAEKHLRQFTFHSFTFSDGLNRIVVPATLIEMNENGVYMELPESSFEIKSREIKRHDCINVSAQIIQEGKIIDAELTSFSAQAFRLQHKKTNRCSDVSLDDKVPVHIIFKTGKNFIFSGNCEIIQNFKTEDGEQLVLKPLKTNIQLFQPKEVRSERIVLNPLPNIHFQHPLTGRRINLPLVDISGTGISVAEDEESAVLMAGLVIPKLKIEFVHGFSVKCRAQVVYRLPAEDYVKCGIAILDMNMKDHTRLSYFLHQAMNKHSFIGTTNIDLDALWDFFFESGFIYPDKYAHIIEQKDRFKKTYGKLYNESPEIARHVIYQDKGKIYGHVSMFRYYQNTWLMHHHAAIKSPKHKAGLVVMEHILQYINECHTLPSARMKYIACYFRPNNRFANRVFGEASRALDDKKKCSLDNFAYLHFEPEEEKTALRKPWSLEKTRPEDLVILRHWYEARSGGLMLEGLDLGPDSSQLDSATNRQYQKNGFNRAREIFSLRYNDELTALIVINRSDIGMNMSDLTNCIQFFVIEQDHLDRKIFSRILSVLAQHYEQKEVPVLLYPEEFADSKGIPFDKNYELTVLDLDNISPYLMFMKSLTTARGRRITHVS